MSLPVEPHRSIPVALRDGDTGWAVFALQRGLNTLSEVDIKADGDFGAATREAVKAFQRRSGLDDDGIAGFATQSSLVRRLDDLTHDNNPALPNGIMQGFAQAEGGNNLGAVNWSVSNGVDCGVMQIRVYGPPYGQVDLRYAFAPGAAMQRTANDFLNRYAAFRWLSYASRQPVEFAKRCAAMAHNWPTEGGADHIARYGKCSNPAGRCSWLPRYEDGRSKVFFPDGTRVETRWEWCEFYAMGSEHGEGRVVQFVRDWT